MNISGHRDLPNSNKIGYTFNPMSRAWIVCRIQPRRESWATLNIQRQGYESYYPKYQERLTGKIKPLFVGYMFVLTNGEWFFLKSTFGVATVVMAGDGPATIRENDPEFMNIRKREDRDGIIRLPSHGFRVGQEIRVREGIFINQRGIFEGQSHQERESILLDFLGCKRRIYLKVNEIEPV